MPPDYDVVIMGGGPAGSSLGARLARQTKLRTAVFEEHTFPREHIGESFASPVIPCLAETGALDPVLRSGCYIRKYGGYYSWDSKAPSVSFFRHRLWQADGIRRWSIHVNRAEFDHILLQHASKSGCDVFEAAAIESSECQGEGVRVRLRDGRELTCYILVDASGRMNRSAIERNKGWLSSYRNVAIWSHFTGGLPAQCLDGTWNIFREPNLSPIGCFAFDQGWCWYIPVMQIVNGLRVRTHSIGLVTDPKVLRGTSCRLTDPSVFLKTLHKIPLLRELIGDIRPVYSDLHTATNYSMISSRMCDYNQRWISVGDASYFVDPLFSSGVSFAMLQAAAAARLIEANFNPDLGEDMKRELWDDYTQTWALTAWSFAVNIDQWYAAIAHENPNSVYWNERASDRAFFDRINSFEWLLDADVTGDLIYVMTRGSGRLAALPPSGALLRATRKLASCEPGPDAVLRLLPGVAIRKSMTFNGIAARSACRPDAWSHGPYWSDPLSHAGEVAPLYAQPEVCFRFHVESDADGPQVRFFHEGSGRSVFNILRNAPHQYGDLRLRLPEVEWEILLRLMGAGMVTAENQLDVRSLVL